MTYLCAFDGDLLNQCHRDDTEARIGLRAGGDGREGARLLDRRDRWADETTRRLDRAGIEC